MTSTHNFDRRTFLRGAIAAPIAAAIASRLDPAASVVGAVSPADLSFASALDAARAIRRKEVSARELTDHILDRIEKYNPKINAVVVDLAESARKRAAEADDALARGDVWGPFHGVPITIKETYGMADVATTAGAPFLKDHEPELDATVVKRMRGAGAVILGKTNVPLMAMDLQSYNEIYGTTNNPWDTSRTPGGSTGGGAAALAAGLSFLSVGSDIGGSIRTPAHFCGVYGHKPTLHVVPRKGHIPPPPGPITAPNNLSVAGPLARSASDLQAAMGVLGGPEGAKAKSYAWSLPPARKTRLKDYRLRFVVDDPVCPVVPEQKKVLMQAVDALRNAGVHIEEGWPQDVNPKEQIETYLYLLLTALAPLLQEPQPAEPGAYQSAIDLPAITEQAVTASHLDVMQKLNKREQFRAVWNDYFRNYDGFLMPTDFIPAFPHDQSPDQAGRIHKTSIGDRAYLDVLYWIAFATVTGFPATVAPVGRTEEGLPVGIQILGPNMEDATPIDIAGRMADLIGGFQPPPGYA